MSKPLLHVTKLKNGKYKYSFEKAKVDGKRNRAYGTFNTEEEAWLEGRKAYNLYYDDGIITSDRMTYAQLVSLWFEKDCKGRVTESTIEGYRKKMKNLILPAIGDKFLTTIQNYHLNSFFINLHDKGYSNNTITGVKALITSTFRFAIVNRFISYDPSYNLRLPTSRVHTTIKTRKKDHVVLSDRTMLSIFNVVKDNPTYNLIIKIGYECGLRRGEIFGLFWDDIDLYNKKMTIRRQMQYLQDHSRTKEEIKSKNGTKEKGNGFWFYKPPKYDSIRTISISNELVELLKAYKELAEKNKRNKNIESVNNYASEYPSEDCKFSKITQNPNDFFINPVFVKENGELETSNICMYLTSKIHKAGITKFDMHSLRKTHSTILQNRGLNLKYVSSRLGHVDTKTTTEFYYDLTETFIKEQEAKLDQLYEQTKKRGLMEGGTVLTKDIIDGDNQIDLDDDLVEKMQDVEW